MPKIYKPKQIIKTLNKLGFSQVSQKGSHIKLEKQTPDGTRTVIIPNHTEVAIGTSQSILKQAGITHEEFKEALD